VIATEVGDDAAALAARQPLGPLLAGIDEPFLHAVSQLAGAADGLRRRVGLGMWPLLRQWEAGLVAEIRQGLEAKRFEEVFAAGTRLNRLEAIAAVRDRRDAGTAARLLDDE